MHKPILTLLAAAVLSACTVGPDYVRPEAAEPAVFAQSEPGATIAPVSDAAFWTTFGDATLARLVDETLTSNLDLAAALARLDRAGSLLREAKLDRFPTVRAQAGAADTRTSTADAPLVPRDERDAERYDVAASVSWELDLYGRVRRNVEAGRADAAATEADLRALRIALAGETARTYVELRGAQERLRVARANATNQAETLRLVQAQLDAGSANDFDRARASAQLAATRSRIPALEAETSRAMHRLAVLTGREPGALLAQLGGAQPLPAVPARIDAGTPGELLRRRPDVAAAEERLHAATARVGVATADLFPRFTLAGLLGSTALDTGDLFSRDTEARSVVLGIDWSFLDTGRVHARIAAADADADAALAQYRQSVLLALEDVENALVTHGRARVEDAHLADAARESEDAARLAHVRYEAGAVGLFEVLDAERVLLQSQDQLAAGRTRTAASAVRLYEALAGGWQSGNIEVAATP
ncbi:MAG TPA: efflux transporter outer membrane subunit [Xanthomonadales bacterium]|nr:efflux transporter outer membrane subunit [Xanthomonadales bacterium]